MDDLYVAASEHCIDQRFCLIAMRLCMLRPDRPVAGAWLPAACDNPSTIKHRTSATTFARRARLLPLGLLATASSAGSDGVQTDTGAISR